MGPRRCGMRLDLTSGGPICSANFRSSTVTLHEILSICAPLPLHGRTGQLCTSLLHKFPGAQLGVLFDRVKDANPPGVLHPQNVQVMHSLESAYGNCLLKFFACWSVQGSKPLACCLNFFTRAKIELLSLSPEETHELSRFD